MPPQIYEAPPFLDHNNKRYSPNAVSVNPLFMRFIIGLFLAQGSSLDGIHTSNREQL